MKKPPKASGPAPGRAQLHEAALRHLARFSTTQVGMVRVLDRRIERWGRAAAGDGIDAAEAVATARAEARAVASALVAAGLIDDAIFANARAARLARAGRSRRAVAAHLATRGVAADVAKDALPSPEQELQSALAFSRRRRLGPFRDEPDAATHLRDLGALGRAGFSRDVAERALRMPGDEALALVEAAKRG